MENLSIYSSPTIKSWEGYLELLQNYEDNKKEVLKKYQGQVLPAGSLSWPGDIQLLKKYKVSPMRIYTALIDIINDFGLQYEICKLEALGESKANITRFVGKYEVKVAIKFKETAEDKIKISTCAYCQEELIHNAIYHITNHEKVYGVMVPKIILHYLEKHHDLGTPEQQGINPTNVCNVLELGNTKLNANDPLFEVVKHGKKTLERLKTEGAFQ